MPYNRGLVKVKTKSHVLGNVVGVLISLAIGGLVFYFLFVAPQIRFQTTTKSMMGKSRQDVLKEMGQPKASYSYKTYHDERHSTVVAGYEPDPPLIECDEVLEYSEMATLALIFVKNDIVIGTYSGGT